MIISNSLKVVFLHNPKVAGTMLRRNLLKYAEEKYLYQGFTPSGDMQDLAHPRMDQVPWVSPLIDTSGWFGFGIIRDPVTRFQSAVNELLRQHGDWVSSFGMPIEKFLLLMLTPASIRHDWRLIHFCPQHEFLLDPTEHPNFSVYRVEMIDDWWDILWSRMLKTHNPALVPELKTVRSSSDISVTLTMSDEISNLITFLYAQDYETFNGYSYVNEVSHAEGSPTNFLRPDLLYKPPGKIVPDMRFHWSRIEYIHRHRNLVKDMYELEGVDARTDVSFQDVDLYEQRRRWDIKACFHQETRYLRGGK